MAIVGDQLMKENAMHRYVVVEALAGSRLIALRDDAGGYHVAHCTSNLPHIRHELIGAFPVVGLALLLDDSGKVFRLIFSQVNCGQSFVFDQLRPTAQDRHV